MPRMRSTKQQLKQYLQSPQWRDHLEEIAAGGASHVGPLFSFLLLGSYSHLTLPTNREV